MTASNARIVVTGMGLVTPLGCGVAKVWERLVAAKSGIRRNTRIDVADLPNQIAGLVPTQAEDAAAGLDIDSVVPLKERKKMDLFTIYALAAAEEALAQANWKPEDEPSRERTATVIASGIGGFPVITEAKATLDARGPRRLSPFVVPAFLANLAAGNVSIRYGFKGPLGTPVTACAAGLQAIGDAMRLIRSGEADVALAGGTEACIDRLSIGGFAAARALSTARNAAPETASRPFDRDRDGFVMGEGAGLLVLETLEHARARGAVPLVELTGYGTSADAYHLTSGPEDGAGAARAMQAALKMAGSGGEEIGYVNAHATATPVGDNGEVAALRRVFGERLKDVAISSTKSAIGHLLGAAGVEAVFTAMAIRSGLLPPTLNLHAPNDGNEDLDFVPLTAKARAITAALCNGFGFGGVNAAIVMRGV